MAMEFKTERFVPLRRVPSWLEERGGKRVSQATIHRWRLEGVRGVRLEAIKIGGTFHTSIEALERFVSALTAAQEAMA